MPRCGSLPPLGGDQDWAAFLALDWADEKHAWCLLAVGAEQPEHGWVVNTPEAIHRWVSGLQQRFGAGRIAVCLEQSRGSVVNMLWKYPQLVLFPAPPSMVAQLRKAFHPSGAKDDPSDCELQLMLLLQHGDQLRKLVADSEATRRLQLLSQARRCFVDERTRQKNRLTSCLKAYYPQMLRWFPDIDSSMALTFLQQWPTLQAAQRAHPGTWHKTLQHCRGKKPAFLANQAAQLYAAVPATEDPAVLESMSQQALALAKVIQQWNQSIDGYDQKAAEVELSHPDAFIFASLPAAGPVTRCRMLAAMGTDRNRFASAAELQCYVGIAPVTERSGKSRNVHLRRGCPRFLRQTFQEYAALSIRKSGWAKVFYQNQRAAGKSHHAAVRALAFKWCRIIYRCWKDRVPYDEASYQRALEQRNSPLRAKLDGDTQFGWEKIAGFRKFVKKIS